MQRKSREFLLVFLMAGLFSSCTYRFYQSDCDYTMPGSLHKQQILDSTLNETSGLLFQGGKAKALKMDH